MDLQLTLSKLQSKCLAYRYRRHKSNPKDEGGFFTDMTLQDDLLSVENIHKLNIDDNVWFDNTEVFFKAKNVKFAKEYLSSVVTHSPLTNLTLICYQVPHWVYTDYLGGKHPIYYEAGRVHTKGTYEQKGGAWLIRAKMPQSFPAIWLAPNPFIIEGYTREQIIPEVDIAEVIKGKIKQSVHWGYTNGPDYTKYSIGNDIFPTDNLFHDYGVKFVDNGYNFYIDGMLVTKYRSKNKEFVNDKPYYLIINNAMNQYSENNVYTELEIQYIKYFK